MRIGVWLTRLVWEYLCKGYDVEGRERRARVETETGGISDKVGARA